MFLIHIFHDKKQKKFDSFKCVKNKDEEHVEEAKSLMLDEKLWMLWMSLSKYWIIRYNPIKSQILYFSMHSIKYTVFQYVCAKNPIKTVCKIYCNTVCLIQYNSIIYMVVQNTVYLQYVS